MKNIFEIASLAAVILGVVLGIFLPEWSAHIAFVGKIFLSLLKVLILPIIIVSLFLAIARISSAKNLRVLGLTTIGYYFSTTAIAVLTGLIVANVFIFNGSNAASDVAPMHSELDFVDRIFSSNIFTSLANGEILQIVVFVIFFSIAFTTLEKKQKKTTLEVSETLYAVIMKLLDWILRFAPLGILSLVWATVASFDPSTFGQLTNFFMATAIAVAVHTLVSLPLVARLVGRFNPLQYFWRVKQAIIVALATASSAATIPVSTKVVEAEGVSKDVTGFVIPIGATLNMDGSALYQALLAMLFVNLAGIDASISQQVIIFVFIALSSAGTAGIPSGGIVMMTMITDLLGIANPDYYLGLYIMVDRFWDYPVTAVNVWGDLVGTKVIDQLVKK